jgi:hypothetical protein
VLYRKSKLPADLLVGLHFVGHQAGIRLDIRANDRLQVGNAKPINMEAAG